MKRWSICRLVVILIFLIQNKITAQEISLIKTTQLSHYPSASALEFYNNYLYVIGDDATHLLILDKEHKPVDSIVLFESKEERINKDEKADIEASVLLNEENKNYLLAFSSFSKENRNKTLILDLENKEAKIHATQLSKLPVQEVNIEGAAWINNQLLLSNRANNTNQLNHLILTKIDITTGNINSNGRIISFFLPQQKMVTGISGLEYLQEKDLLLFTVSTENTSDATSDGPIGESYIGYVSNISKELNNKEIMADKLIGLSNIIGSGTPQKIESLAIEESNDKDIVLHLAADNDNGQSTIFKVKMKLP